MNGALKKFIPIADMLADMIGADCQIVIYDLSEKENGIAYVSNNTLAQSEVAQKVNPVIAQMLSAQALSERYSANSLFVTKDKRLIRAGISLIEGDENDILGAFCVMIDTKKTSTFVNWLLETIQETPKVEAIEPCMAPETAAQEPLTIHHISMVADELIDQSMGGQSAAEMNREDKMNVIHIMDQKGLFLVKGAIEKVAEKLGIAKVTVYSYLDEIKDRSGK